MASNLSNLEKIVVNNGPKWQRYWDRLDPSRVIRRTQLKQMQEEQEWNELMRPQMLKNMGLIEDVDEDGKKILRPRTEDEKLAGMNEEEKSAYQTDKLIAERQTKAARGELGIPSYVTDELARQRQQQGVALSQRLGAKGASLSTPGIQSKTNLMGMEAAAKNAYAYGQESTGMGLLGASQGYLGNLANKNLNVYGGFPNAGVGLVPMGQTAMQPYTYQQKLMMERQAMLANKNASIFKGIMEGVGSAAGIAATIYGRGGDGG